MKATPSDPKVTCPKCLRGRHFRCEARGSCSCSECGYTRDAYVPKPPPRPRKKPCRTWERKGRPKGIYVAPEKVEQALSLFKDGVSKSAIAREVGLDRKTVIKIVRLNHGE